MIFSKPLKVGTPAPPFICPNEDGEVFILNQQRGKKVVLVFYPGDDTPGCRKQLCEIRDKWTLLKEKGVAVFGVNPQSEESHKKFREKFEFPFPLLVDSGKRVAAAYKASGLIVKRTVYGIDKEGIIRFAKRGMPPVEEILSALS